MKKIDISQDSYNTPAGTRRCIFDRLFCGTRIYFHIMFISIICKMCIMVKIGFFSNNIWSKVSYNILNLVEKCGGKIHLKGMSNISKIDGSAIFIPNHMSILETFLFPYILTKKNNLISYVVKQSLIDDSFFGVIMKAIKAIPTSRDNPKNDFKNIISQGSKLLESNTSLVIFLQKNRSNKTILSNINSMGTKLGKKTGVPIIPVALKTDFLSTGKYIKDFGPIKRSNDIYIEFGEPIYVKGNGREEQQQIVSFIQEKLNIWS